MKIERFIFGMYEGKISFLKTEGINDLLTATNLWYLRSLREEDSDQYLWLPTEQVIAYPHITHTEDGDGRDFVQNQTLIIPIHDFLKLVNPTKIFTPYIQQVTPEDLSSALEPLEVGSLKISSKPKSEH